MLIYREVAPVNSILSSHGVGPVDLVKMDVQGFEGQVLAGMQETIAQPQNPCACSRPRKDGCG
jgi:FkbM family methyltransferase